MHPTRDHGEVVRISGEGYAVDEVPVTDLDRLVIGPCGDLNGVPCRSPINRSLDIETAGIAVEDRGATGVAAVVVVPIGTDNDVRIAVHVDISRSGDGVAEFVISIVTIEGVEHGAIDP